MTLTSVSALVAPLIPSDVHQWVISLFELVLLLRLLSPSAQISGSTGAFTWVLLHFIHTGKWTLTGLVSGSICGLVSITPAAGYVGLPASLLFGVAGAGVCFYVDKLRHSALAVRWQILDPAGVFVSHCIG